MTQQEVGDILHRTDSAVSDIENGYSDITLDHLLRMAEGLGVPAAGLLLPDPGAPAPAPYRSDTAVSTGAVIELLANEQKRSLLGHILERLPALSMEQLDVIAQNIDKVSMQKSSAA
jgi:transcriptional regulator with XRE-family HTH domain